VSHAAALSTLPATRATLVDMRVLIVDDSIYFRQAARALLERRGYDVVGEVGSADAAVEAVAGLAPDAVLLDVLLPDGTGFGVCATITAAQPGPAVLLVSSEDFGTCFSLAEQCGARGFVLKSRLGQCELDRFWGEPHHA
jgi:DNA-binding NarL/FixJ family response regulator